jgi:hypothetical protein
MNRCFFLTNLNKLHSHPTSSPKNSTDLSNFLTSPIFHNSTLASSQPPISVDSQQPICSTLTSPNACFSNNHIAGTGSTPSKLQHDRSNAAGSLMSDSNTSVASSASRSASASGLNLVVYLSSYMLHHHQSLVLSASSSMVPLLFNIQQKIKCQYMYVSVYIFEVCIYVLNDKYYTYVRVLN